MRNNTCHLLTASLLAVVPIACGDDGPDLPPDIASSVDAAETVRVQQFLDARYARGDVRHSFKSTHAERVDCVDFFAQPGVRMLAAQGIHITEIPRVSPTPTAGGAAEAVPSFVFNGEPDEDGNARICPEGTVPLPHLTATDIHRAGGLDAFRSGAHRKRLPARRPDSASSPPLPANACDTQFGIDIKDYGHVQATYNNANQDILTVGSSTLSINVPAFPGVPPTGGGTRAQIWMYSGWGMNNFGCHCGGSGQPPCTQSVEAGWEVVPEFYRDSNAHLFTFATNDGYATGCWGGDAAATCEQGAPVWVAVSNKIMPGMTVLAPSQLFGTQTEIQLSAVYVSVFASWTIFSGAEQIGYFSARGFSGAMRTRAQTFQAGGEVYDNTNSWAVPSGSGAMASTGYGQAAYIHNTSACASAGTGCLSPIAGSPLMTRANYGGTSAPAAKPGAGWTNWMYYGSEPSVFWGKNYGYEWTPVGDWAYGQYKGECGWSNNVGQPMIGLSAFGSGSHQAHAIQCGARKITTIPSTCYARTVPPNSQGTSENWDRGYYKASCRATEYVLGVSQTGAGALNGVLCCQGDGTLRHVGCTTQILYNQNSPAYFSNAGGDWDMFYDKGQCPANNYVAGVSSLASSSQGLVGAPHAILCCPWN